MLGPIDCITHYSLLTGLNKPDKLAARVAEFGYKTLGICDYNSIGGCVQLVNQCQKYNLKPIIGIRENDKIYIAKNLNGWKSLIKKASGYGNYNEDLIEINPQEKKYALSNSHYLTKEDASDQRLLLCTKYRTTLSNLNTITSTDKQFLDSDEFYLPSPDELKQRYTSEQIYNTEKLIDSIEDFSIFRKPILPKAYEGDEIEILKKICREAWTELKLDNKPNRQEYINRAKSEFLVIEDAGLAGYFLIVRDYIMWAKNNGILVGPARGSSGGCLAAYLSGIIDIDPVKFNLLFERFYNAGRNTKDHISYPDIDTDFEIEHREKVIQYILNKYTKNKAMRIITYSRLQGKAIIQEVLRAHNSCKREEANRITKNLPQEDKISDELEEANESSTLRWVLEYQPHLLSDWVTYKNGKFYGEFANEFEQAIRLEGTFRGIGTHASGIVISGEDIVESCPITYIEHMEENAVALEYTEAEKLGLLKCDILGLAALDKISNTER